MSSIRTDSVCLDTNIYVFAVRRTAGYPACAQILFEMIPELRLFVPLEILIELHRNLSPIEQDALYDAFDEAADVAFGHTKLPEDLVAKYEAFGAKKGDAVIAAQLEGAGIKWLVSENRHFLGEIPNLPFTVLTSVQALKELG